MFTAAVLQWQKALNNLNIYGRFMLLPFAEEKLGWVVLTHRTVNKWTVKQVTEKCT
jgi:hypothetical protein